MNTLSKNESLKSKTLIRLLFSSKTSNFLYPFKTLYRVLGSEEPVRAQMLISVGKRKIKTAVDRNHIKRLFREAYRLNRQPLMTLLEEKDINIAIAFVYVGDKNPDYQFIEERIIKSIDALVDNINSI